ncbi:Imm49 family immunity protein [Streptomyces sp. NBC_01216]|uniref:immunity 49 family protein n=1 Tax=unclassified Streptomyces TaxID=2593676 RepID=UPI002E127ECA|nr:immunity 49 family protein [Streptomyces sp. NBC_01216]
MRIERHRVSAAKIAAAREDFVGRINRRVRSMSRAGRMTTYEWWLLSEEFLDYLAALSVEAPDLHTPEAETVLNDATEAAAGAVAFAAYFPHGSFQVFLNYVDFGMGYEPTSGASPESVTAQDWLDAFCLAVLAGKAEWHGEAFHFARRNPQRGRTGEPSAELISGLMAYVIGDLGDEGQNFPPSAEERLAALDAALARVRHRDAHAGAEPADHPHRVALRALRGLADGDRDAFHTGLAALLVPYGARSGPAAEPRSLLPLLPLALAALAYRREGWQPRVDTPYLPRALVTGFEDAGPRVEEFGRNRRADAVAALAAGTLTVDRPTSPAPHTAEGEAWFEHRTRERLTPHQEPLGLGHLSEALDHQGLLFRRRARRAADATDLQLGNLRLASRLGAAVFRTALAAPGTDVEVVVDGVTLTCHVASPGTDAGANAGPHIWHTATNFALITGAREDLAPLVVAGPGRHGRDCSAFASYRAALHDYLRGAEPEAGAERAVHDSGRAKSWGFFPPPAVLFSQLVEGDEESFNLALLDALEAHRDHYAVADRADDPDAAVNLDILALTCHARRRGWSIRVASPYLPPRLLAAAVPFA